MTTQGAVQAVLKAQFNHKKGNTLMSNTTATPKVTKRHARIAKRAVSGMPAEKQLSPEDVALLAALIGGSMAADSPEDGDDGEADGDDFLG